MNHKSENRRVCHILFTTCFHSPPLFLDGDIEENALRVQIATLQSVSH